MFVVGNVAVKLWLPVCVGAGCFVDSFVIVFFSHHIKEVGFLVLLVYHVV